MNNPKYTFLLPAYKAQFFAEALESIKKQTYKNFEVIVSDDCSPEDLKSIFDEIVGDDQRFTFRRNTQNIGAVNVVDHWNKCLESAIGNYVICMGDDDRLLPNCLCEYEKLIEKYPNVDVFHTRTELIDENGDFLGLQECRPEWESILSAMWHQCNGKRIQFIGDYLFKTSTLKANGGFYKLPFAVFSDNITVYNIAKENGIANVQELGFQYRQNRYTISHNQQPNVLAFAIKNAWTWFDKHIEIIDAEGEDKKCKHLLQNGLLRKYMQKHIVDLLRVDIENQRYSAFNYWKNNYKEVGVEDWQFKLLKKEYYKDVIKRHLKII